MANLTLAKMIDTGPDANRLYINPANKRYGLFANEGGKSDIVTIIDTQEDVAVKNIFTGLGPHNIAYNPEGTRAAVTTKKEPVATLIDTSSADPMDWDVVHHRPRGGDPEQRRSLGAESGGVEDGAGELTGRRGPPAGGRACLRVPAVARPLTTTRQRKGVQR